MPRDIIIIFSDLTKIPLSVTLADRMHSFVLTF